MIKVKCLAELLILAALLCGWAAAESVPSENAPGEALGDVHTPGDGGEYFPEPEQDPCLDLETFPEREEEPRPDLETALTFWQDEMPELYYHWDRESEVWVADAMESISIPIYVKNEYDQAVGPFNVTASALSAYDAGGQFRLDCELLPESRSMTLNPGERAQIAVFTFICSGGGTDAACEGYFGIELKAVYTRDDAED